MFLTMTYGVLGVIGLFRSASRVKIGAGISCGDEYIMFGAGDEGTEGD